MLFTRPAALQEIHRAIAGWIAGNRPLRYTLVISDETRTAAHRHVPGSKYAISTAAWEKQMLAQASKNMGGIGELLKGIDCPHGPMTVHITSTIDVTCTVRLENDYAAMDLIERINAVLRPGATARIIPRRRD